MKNKAELETQLKVLESKVGDFKNTSEFKAREQKNIIESEIHQLNDIVNGLKNQKNDIQKTIRNTLNNDVLKKVVENKVSDIQTKINNLKMGYIVEKEINSTSTKELREKNKYVNSEILKLKEELNSIQSFHESAKDLTKENLSQLLDSIKTTGLGKELKNDFDLEIKDQELLQRVLDSETPILSAEELGSVQGLNTSHLNIKDLQKFLKVIDINANALNKQLSDIDRAQNIDEANPPPAMTKGQSMSQVIDILKKINTRKSINENINLERNRLSEGVKRKIGSDSDSNIVSLIAQTIKNTETEKQAKLEQNLNEILSEYDGLKSEESLSKLIKDIRTLYVQNLPEFKSLTTLLVKNGILNQNTIEEELGIVLTPEGNIKAQALKPQAIDAMAKLLNTSPAMLEELGGMKQVMEKGRIDRKEFEKHFGKKIAIDAWDYGLLSNNLNSVGMLKDRADINSFQNFWALMSKMSLTGNNEDVIMTSELFLTKDGYKSMERDLISFFIIEYEERFIDPDYHMFDLYNKYLRNNTFKMLPENQREELVIGVLLRVINSMESDNHKLYNKLMDFSQRTEDTKEFMRSVEILEYYFSNGGTIRKEYFDVNKALRFIEEETLWDEEKQKKLSTSAISEFVRGFSKPVQVLPAIKLKSMRDRLRDRLKT